MLMALLLVSMAACSSENDSPNTGQSASAGNGQSTPNDNDSQTSESNGAENESPVATEMYVSFGDAGEEFTLHLYENETAAAIARHVGTDDWRLAIYHYEDYEKWGVMEDYDIPRRYENSSNSGSGASLQAGTV